MKISVKSGRYKSIQPPLEWDEIPEFAVLTGENGGGKSHLLFAIKQRLAPDRDGKNKPLIDGLTLDVDGFSCQPSQVIYTANLSRTISGGSASLDSITKLIQTIKNQGQKSKDHIEAERDRLILEALHKDTAAGAVKSVKNDTVEPWFFYGNPDQLAQSVSQHFVNFWLDCVQYIIQGGSRDEISTKFGEPPWTQLNEMLSTLGLPYSVSSPDLMDIRQPFSLLVHDKRIGEWLKLAELSSGESSILRLILLLYSSEQYKNKPRIFLLDEPDSHLHASLVHVFINAIQTILVRKFGCRVIMISHRVETLSYSPSESIFTMTRNLPRIQKARSDDQAIALLSKNILTVTRGKCAVYVEDHPDEVFYSSCVNVMEKMDLWLSDITPTFIASGISARGVKGGSEIVRTWVTRLRSAGLTNVWGLIDKDCGNESTECIKVIGRYSKENFYFDPIFVFASLLDQGVDISPKLEGSVNLHRGMRLEELSQEKLQLLTNFVCEELEKANESLHKGEAVEKIECCRLGGMKILIPKWVLHTRGHTLAEFMHKSWPAASRKEVEKAFFRHPLLWPEDLRETLHSIVQGS